ncbi:TetR family transcriptional regulator [Rhodococcus sp. X156]|uniref:TetR family transcriptional regulator n=1 Tax=Rhodococcus sp. X156 TaxID=2499145 RepID=UPI000FDBF8EC|nr:TetR family transcriptional regulator [Rhodococcus sp. X156]
MSTGQQTETGTRARTRAAILEAAVVVLAQDAQASLADVAAAAGVGRTTLHRYFPERADLVHALARHVVHQSRRAIERADPHTGPVEAVLRRIVDEHFELGSILMYLYAEPLIHSDPDLAAELAAMEEAIDEVLARPEANLNPDLSRAWVRRAFWGLLYAGWETAKAGEMTRHQIVEAIMTTLSRGVYGATSAAR